MMHDSEALGFPSVGRVLLALLVTIGVAFAAVFMLKRFQHRFGSKDGVTGAMQVIERVQLGTFRIYLLDVGGSRVLLTEKGHTITTTVLPAATTEKP